MIPPLDILFEDDALLFVNKPAGVVVQQRTHHPDEPYLHAAVLRHTQPAYLMQRLDRGTSGVMFFSKRDDANARLTRQFVRRGIRKRYLAICEGELATRRTVDAPLARVGPITFGIRETGRRAVTHVEPVHATPRGSLLAIGLETGRTHQIRVHLASQGLPILGDPVYGRARAGLPAGVALARPALHAARLGFTHPVTAARLVFEAPLPADLAALADALAAAGS
jgi:23S rRNA pseudouridine1911/1915/1917 synthase